MKFPRVWFTVSLLAAAACGDTEVTTGAWAEFRSEIPFSGTSGSHTETLSPRSVEEVAAISNDVVCAYLATGESYVALLDYSGKDDNHFQLKATLVDGDQEFQLFTWQSNLKASKVQVPLSELGVNQASLDQLGIIVGVRKEDYRVRLDFSADDGTNTAHVLLVQKVRLATESGTCPGL